LPDLKSSLNQVHLKIPHALKETNYLTDKENMTGSREIATIIGNYLFKPVRRGLHNHAFAPPSTPINPAPANS
jgi:hypothetical protein